MKNLYIMACLFFAGISMQAQIVVDANVSAQEAVEEFFLGNGIFINNLTYNGQSASGVLNNKIAPFEQTGAEGVGIYSGLLLSTGDAASVDLNASSNPSDYFTTQDLDILSLLPQASYIGEVSVVEFDFIATGDSLAFQYVFASDEYPEFVNSVFNDYFGFFVSGPGIQGPFTNGAVNIAKIPDTEIGVSINSLNADSYSQYYVDNQSGWIPVGFDAWTTVLHACIGQLVVGETYHIKLIITDVSDSALDSGVFLSGSSFDQYCNAEDGPRSSGCLLSSLDARVEYTETCGTVMLSNLSDIQLETTGCYFEMGDGGTTDACDLNTLYSYEEPGVYEVKLVYDVNGYKAKFTVAEILVGMTAAPTPSIIVENGNLVLANWDGDSQIQWMLNGEPVPGANSLQWIPQASGNYSVQMNNGCPSESDEVSIVVGVEGTYVGEQLSIYPNPSQGTAVVRLPSGASLLQIFNTAGQLVSSENVNGMKTIEITLPTGVYNVRTLSDQGQISAPFRWMVK